MVHQVNPFTGEVIDDNQFDEFNTFAPTPDAARIAGDPGPGFGFLAQPAAAGEAPGPTAGAASGSGEPFFTSDRLAGFADFFGNLSAGLTGSRNFSSGLGRANLLMAQTRRDRARQDIEQQNVEARREETKARTETAKLSRERQLESSRIAGRTRIRAAEISAGKPRAPKDAQTYILPDGSNVTSFTGGRTYEDPQTGEEIKMPPRAFRVSADVAADVVQRNRQVNEAQAELNTPAAGAAPPPAAPGKISAAEQATRDLGAGLWSNALAGIDAISGAIFDTESRFPATQANRKYLKLVRQLGKPALLNSSRGAIYEQMIIEDLFPDPDAWATGAKIEALKVPLLIQALTEERQANLKRIASDTLSSEEISERRANNTEIDSLLRKLHSGPPDFKAGAANTGVTPGGITFTVN